MGRTDRVEIAGEMEVDVLHWDHLGVAAARSASLAPEAGAEAGLPQTHNGPLADSAKGIRQPHRRGRLAFASGRGGDGGDEYQLAVGPLRQRVQEVHSELGLRPPIGGQRLLRNTQLAGNLSDGKRVRFTRDLDITLYRHARFKASNRITRHFKNRASDPGSHRLQASSVESTAHPSRKPQLGFPRSGPPLPRGHWLRGPACGRCPRERKRLGPPVRNRLAPPPADSLESRRRVRRSSPR